MMKFIRSTPLAISGLSLAFAALGNLLLPYGIVFRYLCGFLSAILFILFALKVFLDSPHAKAEFKTPVPLSVLPTSTMALMLLSSYLLALPWKFSHFPMVHWDYHTYGHHDFVFQKIHHELSD